MSAKLFFNYGTMHSGKSTQLLMVRNNYQEQGKTAVVVKPSLDTRDGIYVRSRALNSQVSAVLLREDTTVDSLYPLLDIEKAVSVLVDEAQFLSVEQVDGFATLVDDRNIPVLCYGLMTDFQGNLFDGSRRLVELGAKLSEIKTTCWECGSKAQFNMRLQNGKPIFEGDQIRMEEESNYRPVCRKCFNRHRSQLESDPVNTLLNALRQS